MQAVAKVISEIKDGNQTIVVAPSVVLNIDANLYLKKQFEDFLDSQISNLVDEVQNLEVDAREISKGVTYIDEYEAKRLARNIIQTLKDRI